jgi:hypothetical protein
MNNTETESKPDAPDGGRPEGLAATPYYANLGVGILALLRSKAEAEWEYYNPHFLLAITEQIEAYYKVEDHVVDEWVQEMFSA